MDPFHPSPAMACPIQIQISLFPLVLIPWGLARSGPVNSTAGSAPLPPPPCCSYCHRIMCPFLSFPWGSGFGKCCALAVVAPPYAAAGRRWPPAPSRDAAGPAASRSCTRLRLFRRTGVVFAAIHSSTMTAAAATMYALCWRDLLAVENTNDRAAPLQ